MGWASFEEESHPIFFLEKTLHNYLNILNFAHGYTSSKHHNSSQPLGDLAGTENL